MILSVLTDDQIRRIHGASLRILATVGVRIPHAEMRRLLHEAMDAGAGGWSASS